MSEDDAKNLLNSLLQQEPSQVQVWLKSVWKGLATACYINFVGYNFCRQFIQE